MPIDAEFHRDRGDEHSALISLMHFLDVVLGYLRLSVVEEHLLRRLRRQLDAVADLPDQGGAKADRKVASQPTSLSLTLAHLNELDPAARQQFEQRPKCADALRFLARRDVKKDPFEIFYHPAYRFFAR